MKSNITVRNRGRLFIIYLAALSAFAPFSTDIYLASMPTIQHLFHTSVSRVQQTISLFFVAFSIAQLIWGPISDRTGRRPVIIIGMIIFILGSLLCAISQSIALLIVARIVQAIGACSGIVMAIAIVKDSFSNTNELSNVLGRIMGIMGLAPIVAPIVGSYLLVHYGWRSNFYFLASYGLILLIGVFFIKESYPKGARSPLPINALLGAYIKQIRFKPFLLTVVAVAANFSVMFAFISSSAFIYINIYHLAAKWFGYLFAINAAAFILGSLSFSRLRQKCGHQYVVFAAILSVLVGALTMGVAVGLYSHSIWSVAAPSFIVTYGVGVLYPALIGQSLQHVVSYTGIASSLVGTCRFILAAAVADIMAIFTASSALPLALTMFTLNILTGCCMVLYFKYYA